MPVTSNDFIVINATESDTIALDLALYYIQTQMPEFGRPIIEELVGTKVTIEINHDGINQYEQTRDMSLNVIKWDPETAMLIRDEDGAVIGVNSAALTLLHEAVHATDENFFENLQSENEMWDNDAERLASQVSNAAAEEAGEAQRIDHNGIYIYAPNPTEHTYDTGDGEGVWAQMDYEADLEYHYDEGFSFDEFLDEYAPAFGDGGYYGGGDDDTQYPWIGDDGTQRAGVDTAGAADYAMLVGVGGYGGDQLTFA